MRTYLDCVSCFIRQALEASRLATDQEDVHKNVVKEVLLMASEFDMHQSPPAMGQKIHSLIRQVAKNEDPYYKAKKYFNELVLDIYPDLKKQVENSDDPFDKAVRFAIAGNIIDFGPKSSVNEAEIKTTVKNSLTDHLDPEKITSFKKAVSEAQSILYLADNAGEIVLDHLLIEQLPAEKITVAVRGYPIINDATVEDAKQVGLDKIVEVIDNGSNAPGTILDTCSKTFIDRFEKADLIIAKGQGNYETLSGVDKKIVFLLKVKCHIIAKNIGCDVGRMILHQKN